MLSSAALFAVAYAIACGLVFLDKMETERVTESPVEAEDVTAAEKRVPLRSGDFYRQLAVKLPYYAHDPSKVDQFFRLSLIKAPAGYESFVSYAYYLVSRNCCKERVFDMLGESIRRCPTNPKIHRLAAVYFLSTGEVQKSLPYFKKVLEIDPTYARQLYLNMEEYRQPVKTLIYVTPDSTDAQIQLAFYLTGRKEQAELRRIAALLKDRVLEPKQRLAVATIALRAGLEPLAQEQARRAADIKETRIEALQFMANMLWEKDDWSAFEKVARSVQDEYVNEGQMEQAAEYAVSVAGLLSSRGKTGQAKEYLLKTIDRYPRCAPAYYLLSALSRTDSPEAFIYYLHKACALDEDNVGYKTSLAAAYLSHSKPREAADVYNQLLQYPEYQEEAILGLSECQKMNAGALQAIITLQQGLERVGRTKRLLLRLGELYGSFGEYNKAVRILTEYVSLFPADAGVYGLLADNYLRAGQYQKAKENYLLALEKDPQNFAAQKGLSQAEMLTPR